MRPWDMPVPGAGGMADGSKVGACKMHMLENRIMKIHVMWIQVCTHYVCILLIM